MLGECVYVCLHAQMHTPHMAVCGRKSYWWIIALTFEADPITALCLTLPLPSSPPLIPLFFNLLSSVLYLPNTHTHTRTENPALTAVTSRTQHVNCWVEMSGGRAHIWLDMLANQRSFPADCGCKTERAHICPAESQWLQSFGYVSWTFQSHFSVGIRPAHIAVIKDCWGWGKDQMI